MPTKAPAKKTKPTVEELERQTKVAEAAVLHARADVLRLEDRLEKVAVERAGVTVKSAGSKTEAMRLLEELDKERASLERSLSLATGAVGELEADLEAAEDALAEEQERVAAERERLERKKLQADLLAAEEAMQEAKRRLEALSGPPSDRQGRRVATVFGKWLPPGVRLVVAEPPLATRGDDAS